MRKHLPLLSKTRYLYGVQCDKRLYLDCYRPELLGEVSTSTQYIFDQGHEVGELATRRYPHGVRISYDRAHFPDAAAATARAMADSSVPAIFEAAFEHAGVRIRVDILVRRRRGWWRVEEVKSSTTVQDVHLHDLAVQLFVLDGCGLRVCEAGILHLDREYVRASDLDLDALFRFVELRRHARAMRREVMTNLRRWRRQLRRRSAPEIEAGRQCFAPYACPFTEHCIPSPGRFSIRRLPTSSVLVEKLQASAPDDLRRLPVDVPLTRHQERAIECIKADREYVAPTLEPALAAARAPIYFLDFETYAPAAPRYRGARSYQALPFQWSAHVLRRDGSLEHREYLHLDDSDPRRSFLERLLEALGRAGSIVVYTSFENTQLGMLADRFRDRRRRVREVQDRLIDLHKIVRDHYYHPDLDGSFSLKALVPVLVPTLRYGVIGDGAHASAAYVELIRPDTMTPKRAMIQRELRRYCRADTLAMVKVWRALKQRAARTK